jgi:GTP cyclohydrolase I
MAGSNPTVEADPREDGRHEPLPAKPLDRDRAEVAIAELLIALGQGGKAEVMENTPRRVVDLYEEQFNAPWVDIEPGFKVFDAEGYDDLVIVNDCHYVSMCEHHLAPAFGVAHFAYVPDGFIVGYSKIKKALNYLARQPQLNERLLVGALDFVEAQLRPKGIGLVLRSVHTCLACKANAPSQEVVTLQGLRGVLKRDPWRREFIASVYASPPRFLT